MFPSPPSPQQKRWFLAYAYNFINVRGNLPEGDPRRQGDKFFAFFSVSFGHIIKIRLSLLPPKNWQTTVPMKTLRDFLRSVNFSFYYRDDTLYSVLKNEGAPFFTFTEDRKVILNQTISADHMKQIRHLVSSSSFSFLRSLLIVISIYCCLGF
jgi:hypothetical protein